MSKAKNAPAPLASESQSANDRKSDSAKLIVTAVCLLVACLCLWANNKMSTKIQESSALYENTKAVAEASLQHSFPDTGNKEAALVGELLATAETNLATAPQSVFEQAREASRLCDADIASAVAEYAAAQKRASVKTEMASRPGMVGRFVIPSCGIDVATISSPADTAQAQAIVDAADSAAYIPWGDCVLIADHNHQGFRGLTGARAGTSAQFLMGDNTANLVCLSAFNGKNERSTLTDNNGTPVSYPGAYITYTCLDNAYNVRICIWVPV